MDSRVEIDHPYFRALYFGDLANRYSRQKQWITGLTFFLSSGAAATIIAKLPLWVPMMLSTAIAIMTAYAVALNLDSKIRTMVKLHCGWHEVAHDYTRLWNHTYSEEAEADFEELVQRELDLSELATTDAPNDPKRLLHWEDQVLKLHRLESA